MENETSSNKPEMSWRSLAPSDVSNVVRIGDLIHTDLPERPEVFTERIKLFPEGCLALVRNDTGEMFGYAISHPIRHRQIPSLNSFLQEIAPDADQYYIHDLALLPSVRGSGRSREAVDRLLAVAGRFATTCLISVYDTKAFWGRFRFEAVDTSDQLSAKLVEYGEDATYLERINQ